MQERVPSVEHVRNLVDCLSEIVRQTGPNTPPGFETGYLNGKDWAIGYNLDVYMNVLIAEAYATDPPFKTATGWNGRGWMVNLLPPFEMVADVAGELLEEWGMTRCADQPPD